MIWVSSSSFSGQTVSFWKSGKNKIFKGFVSQEGFLGICD